jgi:hypothetical protein
VCSSPSASAPYLKPRIVKCLSQVLACPVSHDWVLMCCRIHAMLNVAAQRCQCCLPYGTTWRLEAPACMVLEQVRHETQHAASAKAALQPMATADCSQTTNHKSSQQSTTRPGNGIRGRNGSAASGHVGLGSAGFHYHTGFSYIHTMRLRYLRFWAGMRPRLDHCRTAGVNYSYSRAPTAICCNDAGASGYLYLPTVLPV